MLLCLLTVVVHILYVVVDEKTTVSHHRHSLNELHALSVRSAEDIMITVRVFDFILIYGIMVLALWESLFSFYRYYTTMHSLKSLEVPSAIHVLAVFSIYAVVFMVIFLATMHLYYFIFPLVILCHFLFNMYCTWKFTVWLKVHDDTIFCSLRQ